MVLPCEKAFDAGSRDESATATHTLFQVSPHAGRILIVDDQAANLVLLSRMLARDGHIIVRARTGEEAIELVGREQPDLVLLDVMMPGMSGFEVCRELKRQTSTRLIPVVLITALQDAQNKIEGIDAGADDFLTKPVNPYELRARVRSLLRIKRYTDDLDSAESVILSLALTIEARDAYTEGHCQRLAAYAAAFGHVLGLGEDDIAALERGGFLHDVGKVGIPDAVLLKPQSLTRAEYEIVKQHTVIGDRLCGGLRALKRVRPIVRHHHEHLDGSGYPDGLRGDDIPLLAQIMSIVDVFDAVTTTRPYRRAESAERAQEALAREVACGWRRADLVDPFIALVRSNGLPRFDAATGLKRPRSTGL
jgi:putative two-component system response regulator